MRKLKKPKQKKRIQKQCAPFLSLTLAASMLLSPASPLLACAGAAEDDYYSSESSYNYAQTALDKLSEWHIMRGDDLGNLNPDAPITRAEFVAMINRAYGYTETGPTSFQDVPENAWYADDIAIAHQVGYFTGTSATTAAPDDSLTREQATLLLLVKNARMQSLPGEVTEFADGREFGNWSAGYIKAAYKEGLISGYPDGTYRPTQPITRGETAKLLYNTLGNLISSEGTHSLADVYGNVTINAPGATLKDTTIAGDLYITGGLGLGAVTLDNVKVLGRIVVAGTGASESSQDSVIIRNVDADKLIVDSITDQYLSLRAEGSTVIDETSLRTGVFLRDNTDDGYGLTSISLDSPSLNAQYTLAGDLQTITNKAKESIVTVGDGVLDTLTVDESATNARLNLESNATVKTLNLDTGIAITGQGDIGTLNISAAGVSTTMLPDKIEIRPGLSATIAGKPMNQTTAQESSSEPRLLAGYPKTTDVAPKTAKGLFKTNKAGKVYWGISSITDGSLSETELVTPNSYKTKVVQNGNVAITEANKEISVNITGLTTGGSYYLSAILVDDHGKRSPVKVYSFSTPDETVPNFSSGYPYMSLLTDKDAQVGVMANKSCNLYYALLSKGSVAPKAEDFRTAAIPGNLGFGVVPMTRNLPDFFQVNNQDLEELEEYDLYLWLCDADGGKSSAVKKLTFKTLDKTPPIFQTDLTINSIKSNALGAITNVNEDATVYWVLVPAGEQYPKPAAGETETPALNSDFAKLQVSSGMGALKSGSVRARANTDVRINMSGLQPETAYDIYYLAKDTAGNYSDTVKKITANTLDNIAPTATQAFNRFYGTNDTEPYANSDVQIIFSENILYTGTGQQLLDLYTNRKTSQDAMDAYTSALRNMIRMYNATGSGLPQQVNERLQDDPNNTDWVIDYRFAQVALKEKNLIVTFPSSTSKLPESESALNMRSGSTYYFELENIADTSSARNVMGLTRLPRFTTIAAQVSLDDSINVTTLPNFTEPNDPTKQLEVDMSFSLTPLSTSKVDDSVDWDMIIWMDTTSNFDLYRLDPGATEWVKLPNTARIQISAGSGTQYIGQSLFRDFEEGRTDNPPLKTLQEDAEYQYAIRFTEVDGISDRSSLSQLINGKISIITGSSVNLGNLANNITDQNYADALEQGIDDIGIPENFTLRKQFKDTVAPTLTGTYPHFINGDTVLDMDLLLNRPGTVYYAIAPVGTVITQNKTNQEPVFTQVPTNGNVQENPNFPYMLSVPSYAQIVNPKFTSPRIKTGSVTVEDGVVTEEVRELETSTDYYVYLVTKGTGQIFSDPYLFRFTTDAVTRPIIELTRNNPIVTVKSDLTADYSYVLMPYNEQMMDEKLKQDFVNIVEDKNASIFNQHPEYLQPGFSVLNAMATNVANGNKSAGSLFDLYATQTAKDSIAEFIRSSSTITSGSIVGGGNGSVAGGKTVNIDCSKMNMQDGVEYVLAVVGRSTMGSGDAFRAIYPITLNDGKPPQVQEVNYQLDYDPDTKLISGQFTLNFSKTLYCAEQNQSLGGMASLRRVDNGPRIDQSRDDENYISIESLVDPTATTSGMSAVTDSDYTNRTTEVLTIQCDNVKTGAYIYFNNIADYNNNTGRPRLSVRIQVVDIIKDEEGNVIDWSFDVSLNRAWDARTTSRR